MDDWAKAGPGIGLAAEIAAAFEWWREAGVDNDFGDEPVRWLAPAETKSAAHARLREGGGLGGQGASSAETRGPRLHGDAENTPPSPHAIDRSGWPEDLAAFTPWWLSDPALDDGRVTGRVPPRGPADAEVMVVVPDP